MLTTVPHELVNYGMTQDHTEIIVTSDHNQKGRRFTCTLNHFTAGFSQRWDQQIHENLCNGPNYNGFSKLGRYKYGIDTLGNVYDALCQCFVRKYPFTMCRDGQPYYWTLRVAYQPRPGVPIPPWVFSVVRDDKVDYWIVIKVLNLTLDWNKCDQHDKTEYRKLQEEVNKHDPYSKHRQNVSHVNTELLAKTDLSKFKHMPKFYDQYALGRLRPVCGIPKAMLCREFSTDLDEPYKDGLSKREFYEIPTFDVPRLIHRIYSVVLVTRMDGNRMEIEGWLPASEFVQKAYEMPACIYDPSTDDRVRKPWLLMPYHSTELHSTLSLMNQLEGFNPQFLLDNGSIRGDVLDEEPVTVSQHVLA